MGGRGAVVVVVVAGFVSPSIKDVEHLRYISHGHVIIYRTFHLASSLVLQM